MSGAAAGGGRWLLYANCFPPARALEQADLLLSDEPLVAAAAGELPVLAPELGVDVELAHDTSAAMCRMAFEWFRASGEDPSIVSGISAGDLAAGEATNTVLMPAARGALAMAAALERCPEPERVALAAPAGEGRYAQLETLAMDAAAALARARLGPAVAIERVACADARNAPLRDKYARTRDADQIAPADPGKRALRALALGAVNAASARGRGRRRPRLLVVEYNPTRAFARLHGARRARCWQLVCLPARPRELLAIAGAGDGAILPSAPDLAAPPPCGVEERLRERRRELAGSHLQVAGVQLWPVVGERLLALAERYGRYAAALAPRLAAELERRAIRAVLVPYDIPATARLIVRVAQSLGIPTFVLNDGYKADDIQLEGMTADVALTWSAAMREHYFARRPDGALVTGNPRAPRPRAERPAGAQARSRTRGVRVLVGGFTFSPIDLNCRRSDSERFLDEVLAGIAGAAPHVDSRVLVKLHPADEPGYYSEILARHRLEVELRARGDVIDLLDSRGVYVTTYSTSLIEAIAHGVPAIYYRVNAQRFFAPFSGDEFLAGRTASTPAELTALLADRNGLSAPPPPGWTERYLGPATGSVDRIVAAIERVAGPHGPAWERNQKRSPRSHVHV